MRRPARRSGLTHQKGGTCHERTEMVDRRGCAGAVGRDHGGCQGATLFSPAISINAGTHTSCRVVNVSPTSRTITIQLFRWFAGLDITEFSDCADEVLPGTTCAVLYRNQTGGGEDVYCKITVNGGKNSVRGVLSIEGTCNATCETSVAVEAR
jgi:hypothetical protein